MKIQAYKVSEKALAANRMMNFSELSEGSKKIVPIKMRNIQSYAYHVAEDVKGDIYLINDDEVMLNKLYSRNIGISEVKYMLDGEGRKLIEQSKKEQPKEETIVETVEEVEETEQIEEENQESSTEGESNE